VYSNTKIYREGKTSFCSYIPKDEKRGFIPTNLKVFYNPKMVSNRDISLLVCNHLSQKLNKKILVCEPLSGSGIRGVRFGNEMASSFERILLNDINYEAYKLIQYNIRLNNLTNVAKASNDDANSLLSLYSRSRWNFDYIDIDPFGSPIPFLNSAIRAIRKRDSILALTSTDMSVLCGVYPLKAFKTYGGFSFRTDYCHEIALRLLIHKVNHELNINEVGMKPLLSYYSDNYVRTYIEIRSREKSSDNLEKYIFLEHCSKCHFREVIKHFFDFDQKCPECGEKLIYAGPMWSGELSDKNFVNEILALRNFDYLPTYKNIKKLLNLIAREIGMPVTYYNLHSLCDSLQIKVPKTDEVISLIKNNNYNAVRTHFNSRSVKTDAPVNVIKKILFSLSKK
jgi:tRNA (guanine26-N2/guanine27-N2)-dimethyltransferase